MNGINYNVKEVLEKSSKEKDTHAIYHCVEYYLFSIIKEQYGEYIFLDRERLKNVENRLNEVERRLDDLEESHQEIIIVEEMDIKTAKQKVLAYTKKHRVFDIIELHQNIRCDLGMLIKILDDLKKEGRIDRGI